jgi:ipoprotein LpqH
VAEALIAAPRNPTCWYATTAWAAASAAARRSPKASYWRAASTKPSPFRVSTGGAAEVKVDGSDLAGVDPASVTCIKQGGKINIGSGAAGPQQAVAVVMTDEATPKVESVALVVDGNALAVSDMMGVKTGSAEVKVDGSTYSISGEAQGADMKNPMAGMITKKFEIKVTCS